MSGDFFALFGLSPQFDIDLSQLESRYVEMQNQFHPDRFAGKTGAEKLLAQGQAVSINEAYQTLKDPLKRAGHILAQNGVKFDIEAERTIHDQGLLLEMLERRERLEDIASAVELQAVKAEMAAEIKSAHAALSALLASRDWDGVQKTMLRLRYLDKFQTELREKQMTMVESA